MAGHAGAIEPDDTLLRRVERPEAADRDEPEEPLLAELARVFRTYRRPYLMGIVIAAAIGAALAFLLPTRYRATASLMAVGSGMPQGTLGRLARIANIAPPQNELPAEVLCALLKSRRVSDPILDQSFERWPGDTARIPFKNVLSRTRPGKEPAREKLYRKLSRRARFQIDPETRIVSLSVETRYPHLSAQVANAYLENLNRYATEEHQARSRLTARFVGERLDEVRKEIRAEEERLHAFYRSNQNYATSTDADIRIEQLRLERNLELQARIMMELASNQQSDLIEQRSEAPRIQIIDRGAPPEVHCWPQRRLLVGGMAGGAAVVGFVLMLLADHFGIRPRRHGLALAPSRRDGV